MTRVLVVYASRHGSTAGIAERIATVLRAGGAEAVVADAATRPEIFGYDAYVVASGVYMGSWLRPATEWLERNVPVLATRPVYLVSSGPLAGSSKDRADADGVTNALGPAEGPGSGGRKRVEALATAIEIRQHVVFDGAYDPHDPPKALSERLVRMMPTSNKILPTGDFRDWDRIETWAREVAREVIGSPEVVATTA